ncbi:MAG: hypothetical protein ACLPTJ_10880 [Solirubrobacteraceae bacterium]
MRLLAEIALITLAAIGVLVCVILIPSRGPAALPRTVRPRPRPDQLVTLERLVSSAEASTLHTHAYLRPVLVEVATRRLAAHGYALNSVSADAGRRLLGDPLWDLVRPGRPFPEDRHAPGIPGSQIAAMLDVLERL